MNNPKNLYLNSEAIAINDRNAAYKFIYGFLWQEILREHLNNHQFAVEELRTVLAHSESKDMKNACKQLLLIYTSNARDFYICFKAHEKLFSVYVFVFFVSQLQAAWAY